MMKWVIVLWTLLWCLTGNAHTEMYYYLHPTKLQKALDACTQQTAIPDCDELKQIAIRLNNAAFELRRNPQYFGKQILDLQETIAKQEVSLENNPTQSDLAALLKNNRQELQRKLAIIKWLESPES